MTIRMIPALAIAAGLLGAAGAQAATTDFSYRGTFGGDADVLRFTFTIGAPSNVVLRSYSYAGGTQADGTVVAAGGFDPILALWDSAGVKIGQHDDGPGPVPADPATGSGFDTHLILAGLAAGTYTATVAQYANFSVSNLLADGFQQSNPNFTAGYGCSNGQFCDVSGANRTNFWAFDVLGVDSVIPPAPVPLPGGLALMAGALAGLGVLRRSRRA